MKAYKGTLELEYNGFKVFLEDIEAEVEYWNVVAFFNPKTDIIVVLENLIFYGKPFKWLDITKKKNRVRKIRKPKIGEPINLIRYTMKKVLEDDVWQDIEEQKIKVKNNSWVLEK